jgi:uncharacterized protein YcbK (DUF882 family)
MAKKVTGKVTHSEILMGRDKESPLSPEQKANLDRLVVAVNIIRKAYNKPMKVSSGYRPGIYNLKAGGAKRSAHLTCEAVDFRDQDGSLAAWCENNLQILVNAGLYMENSAFTPGWVHLQTRPTKNRIFIP